MKLFATFDMFEFLYHHHFSLGQGNFRESLESILKIVLFGSNLMILFLVNTNMYVQYFVFMTRNIIALAVAILFQNFFGEVFGGCEDCCLNKGVSVEIHERSQYVRVLSI